MRRLHGLGRTLEDADGVTHPMAGLLPLDTSFAKRRAAPGLPPRRIAGRNPIRTSRHDLART